MEILVDRQDPAWIFRGSRPEMLEAVEKKILVTAGKFTSIFAAHQQKSRKRKTNLRNIRELRQPNKGLQNVLLGRLLQTHKQDDPQIGQILDTLVPALVQALNKEENQ